MNFVGELISNFQIWEIVGKYLEKSPTLIIKNVLY